MKKQLKVFSDVKDLIQVFDQMSPYSKIFLDHLLEITTSTFAVLTLLYSLFIFSP